MFSTGTGDINPTWWSKPCGRRSLWEETLGPHFWTWDKAASATAIWTVAGVTLPTPLIWAKQGILPWFPVGPARVTPTSLAPYMGCSCNGSLRKWDASVWWAVSAISSHSSRCVFFSIVALWSLVIIVLLVLQIKWVFEPSKGSSVSLAQSQPC